MTPEQNLLLAELKTYRGVDEREEGFRQTIMQHVAATPHWWHRDTLPGHVTASAFVVTPDLHWLLLHYHRKLHRWLQFGGHDDGEQHPAKAALRELAEESGLNDFSFFGQPIIFDLDIHEIPPLGQHPAHQHLDVRYLFVAPKEQALEPRQGESNILRWVEIQQTHDFLQEEGGKRVAAKLKQIQLARKS